MIPGRTRKNQNILTELNQNIKDKGDFMTENISEELKKVSYHLGHKKATEFKSECLHFLAGWIENNEDNVITKEAFLIAISDTKKDYGL